MNHVDLSPEEKDLIAAARIGVGPSEVQRARVRRGLGAKLAAGAALPILAGSSAMAMAGKLGVGVALVATLGAGAAYWTLARPTPTPPTVPARPGTRPTPAVAPPAPPSTPSPTATSPEAKPAPAAATAIPSPVARTSARGKAGISRREPHPVHGPSLAGEVLLLTQANAAIKRGDVTRAAALLGDYDQRFPRGTLAEERAAADILLLCAAGRVPEARAKARGFIERWPRSPQRVPLQLSCARTGPAK